MIHSIENFYAGAKLFAKELDIFVAKHNLEKHVRADHICFKCQSQDEFESIRKIFEIESEYVYQSIISNRRIAYIKLKKGIETSVGEIFFVELSDQKPDGSQVSRYDHIEIYPVHMSYHDLVHILKKSDESSKEVSRPHHSTFDITLPSSFLIRVEKDALIDKIKREEMV